MPLPADGESAPAPPVTERDRAVLIARHLRNTERLTIPEIATRLGRSPSTVAGYFSDPNGERARRYKTKYRNSCERCGAPTATKPGVRLCRSCWRQTVTASEATCSDDQVSNRGTN